MSESDIKIPTPEERIKHVKSVAKQEKQYFINWVKKVLQKHLTNPDPNKNIVSKLAIVIDFSEEEDYDKYNNLYEHYHSEFRSILEAILPGYSLTVDTNFVQIIWDKNLIEYHKSKLEDLRKNFNLYQINADKIGDIKTGDAKIKIDGVVNFVGIRRMLLSLNMERYWIGDKKDPNTHIFFFLMDYLEFKDLVLKNKKYSHELLYPGREYIFSEKISSISKDPLQMRYTIIAEKDQDPNMSRLF